MTLWIELRCSGPEGPNNGCPEGFGEHGFGETIPDSHDALKAAYAGLMVKAETQGWKRDKKTSAFRCPACAAASTHPSVVAGVPWEKYIQAIEQSAAGKPTKDWSGVGGMPTAQKLRNAIAREPELERLYKARPNFKPQGKHAEPVPEDRWAEVLRRFEDEQKQDICTGVDGWPTAKQWNVRMHRDDAFRERVNAIHARRNSENRRKIDWTLALERFLAGEHLADLFGKPGMPNKSAWGHRLNTDPEFRAKVYAQHEKLENGVIIRQMGEAPYDKVLEHLREGMWLRDACRQPNTVAQQTFSRRVHGEPEFKARYENAIATSGRRRRYAGSNLVARRFERAADWLGAIDALKNGAYLDEVIGRPLPIENFPTKGQWYYRISRDPEFAAIVATAIRTGDSLRPGRSGARITSPEKFENALKLIRLGKHPRAACVAAGMHVKSFRHRMKRDPEFGRRARAALEFVRPADPIGTAFKRKLYENEVYSTCAAVVPPSLPPHVKDDVVSSMVLAVLEGGLRLEDVKTKVSIYVSKQRQLERTFKDISLDATVGDSDSPLSAFIAADRALWARESVGEFGLN